ncbi:hypothetical protein I3843_03G211400 [Carya illinoinensis]|nr:hypothetical protein I3843_03G211400 [Carya illinoinensis]
MPWPMDLLSFGTFVWHGWAMVAHDVHGMMQCMDLMVGTAWAMHDSLLDVAWCHAWVCWMARLHGMTWCDALVWWWAQHSAVHGQLMVAWHGAKPRPDSGHRVVSCYCCEA